MAVGTIDTGTFTLFKKGAATPIAAVVSYDAASTRKALLNPNANLRRGAKYKAVVTTGATDLAGNGLDQRSRGCSWGVDSTLHSMNAPDGSGFLERAEWVLSLREPRPPSRFQVVFVPSLVVFCAGGILWYTVSGRWDEGESLSVVGAFFLGLCVLAETAGSLLHARGRTTWGRELRVLGKAVFFPLALVCYWAAFRSGPTLLFVVESVVLGGWFVWVAVRLGSLAWRRE